MFFFLSTLMGFTATLFLFQLSGVQAAKCNFFTAVDQSMCPAGLKDKIVAGLADINDCMETKRDRHNRSLKGSFANDIITMRDDVQGKQDQDERMLQLPSCKCCDATGGGGAGCPRWWCVGPGGCQRRRDLAAATNLEKDTTDEQERQLLVAGFDFAAYGFWELDNSKCLPPNDGSSLGRCLINAVTASDCKK
ncbi:hypothetical protein ACA910_011907 [Epithemia clementina (nom. ined.)]